MILAKNVTAKMIFPEGGGRARKVVKGSNHGHVYKFPSLKCRRLVEPEYGLEYDRAYILEMDPDVIWFQEQPCRIEYVENGTVKKLFPDYLVKRRDGSLTIEEDKLKKDAETDEFKNRCEIEERIVVTHGYLFEKNTEEQIRVEPRLANAKKLRTYQRFPLNPLTREAVLEVLQTGSKSGVELVALVETLDEDRLFTMASHCLVRVDHNQPLSLNSMFSSVE